MQKFLGCVAMAFGALVLGLCGLCTATVLGPMLLEFLKGGGRNDGGLLFVSAIAMAIDAIPVAIGILLFRAGWRLYRK